MPVPSNLVVAPTCFVGRGAALTEIRTLLDASWLVTLLGPGGMGKTRLALRVAELEGDERVRRWPGGVWWCDLVEARDATAACGAIAHALGAALVEGEPVDATGRLLAGRGPLLIVLDNCERIVPSLGAMLARLRSLAPNAHWLLTSRERMRVAGEQPYVVPPLSLPKSGSDPLESEAVQLFLERTDRAWSRRASQSAEELGRIAALVHQLDGMPLAIELAAARTGVLSTTELSARLRARFELLSAGPRDADRRHRSLRAALDTSWELLSDDEKRVLRQCAVFRGGLTMEAAEHVVENAARGDVSVLQLLEALHDKSLLHPQATADEDGRQRLGLYESVREYAMDRLDEAGERGATEARHRVHFAQWGTTTAEAARFDSSCEAAAQLVGEVDNLLVAHERAMHSMDSDGAADDALRLAVALHRPMVERSVPSYLALVDATLTHPAARRSSAACLAEAYCVRGRIHAYARSSLAVDDFDRALDYARQANDEIALAMVVMYCGVGVSLYSDLGEVARERVARALVLFQKRGLPSRAALALTWLSQVELQLGNLEAARTHAGAAVELLREHGGAALRGHALSLLGELEHLRGNLDGARRHYAEALDLLGAPGNRRTRTIVVGLEAIRALEQGDRIQASNLIQEVVKEMGAMGDTIMHGWFTAVAGAVAATADDVDEAEQLADEAERELIPAGPIVATATLCRGHIDLARARLATRGCDAGLAARMLEQARGRLTAIDGGARRVEEVLLAEHLLRGAIRRHTGHVTTRTGEEHETLLVHRTGDWFQAPGSQRVICDRRPVLRELLSALAAQREVAPGEPVIASALVHAAWPDENLNQKTWRNRLHAALNSLRNLGLRGHLVATGRGYMLDPRVPCRIVDVDLLARRASIDRDSEATGVSTARDGEDASRVRAADHGG